MKYRLGDLVQIKYGKDHKKLNAGNIPVYGTGGLMRRVNDFIYDGDSVLIPRKGSLNNVMYVTSKFWTVDTMFWTKIDKNKILPKYLYYCLSKIDLSTFNVGSAVPSLTIKILNEITLEVPSLQIQNEIISKIKPIEDKIRLNNKINDNLVKLVDSYFINFLNNVTTVEKTIEDIGTVVGGGTPSKKIADYWNGDIAWVTPKDLSQHPLIFTSSGENYITGLGLAKGSAKLLPTNTILFSSRAPIGYISIAKNNLATNQGFKSVIPNKEYSFQFIYELLKHETAAIKNEANGSTFKEISGKKLKQHIINIPNSEDTSKFNEITKPIFKQLRKLEEENEELLAIKKGLLEKYF
ncbi:restriction endonuclease subunit S [Limosilactobacillus reuteri]